MQTIRSLWNSVWPQRGAREPPAVCPSSDAGPQRVPDYTGHTGSRFRVRMASPEEERNVQKSTQTSPVNLIEKLSAEDSPVYLNEKVSGEDSRGRITERKGVFHEELLPARKRRNVSHRSESFDCALQDEANRRAKELARERERLTIFSQPRRTIANLIVCLRNLFLWFMYVVLYHWVTIRVVLPIALTAVILSLVPGPHANVMVEIFTMSKLAIWWVGLGVLSSVGLGCGIHSGLLYLFPHIYLICHSAELCNSTLFDSRVNMWSSALSPGDHFECSSTSPVRFDGAGIGSDSSPLSADDIGGVTLAGLAWHVIPVAILWGMGTAIGELPPYFLSKFVSEEFEKLESDLKSERSISRSIKQGMVSLIRNYGPVAVVCLSCWPNAFFDLCGVVCGHCGMPLFSFFVALCIGKGVLKVVLQSLFFIFVFSKKYDESRASLITYVADMPLFSRFVSSWFGGAQQLHDRIVMMTQHMREGINHNLPVSSFVSSSDSLPSDTIGSLPPVSPQFGLRHRILQYATPSSTFRFVVRVSLFYFVIRVINQFAQMRQKELDDKTIKAFTESFDQESVECIEEFEYSSVSRRRVNVDGGES